MTAICKHRTGRKNGGLFSVGQTDFARDVSKTKQPRSITPAIQRTPNQGPETGSEKKNSSTWSLFVAAVTRTSIPLNHRRLWPASQKEVPSGLLDHPEAAPEKKKAPETLHDLQSINRR